ncbi:MAG: repeat protein [Planctomycetaceae bacterium]|nr:repeat protein [Planctomycetaceae bacterium]
MISQQRVPRSECSSRNSNLRLKSRHAAGRALTEIILIAIIPAVTWLLWSALTNDSRFPWQSPGTAVTYGPLKTVRDVIDLKDGKILVVHRNGDLRCWDPATKTELGEFPRGMDELRCGAFSAKKRILALAGPNGTLQICNVDEPEKKPLEINADTVSVCACGFASDEETLITAGGTGDLKFWNASTGTLKTVLSSKDILNAIHCFLRSADGQFIYTGTFNGTVYKWRLADLELQGQFQEGSTLEDPDRLVVGLFELPGTNEIAVASRAGTISIWNHVTCKPVRTLESPLHYLISATATQNGQYLFGVNEKGTTRMWDLYSGKSKDLNPFSTNNLRYITVSTDGACLIGGDNLGTVEFVNLEAAIGSDPR